MRLTIAQHAALLRRAQRALSADIEAACMEMEAREVEHILASAKSATKARG